MKKYITIISLPDYKIEETGINTDNMDDIMNYLKKFDYGDYYGELYNRKEVMKHTREYTEDNDYFLSTDGMQYTLYLKMEA